MKKIYSIVPIIILIIIFIASPTDALKRRYRGYKVKEKRKTVVLPFKSKTLSLAVCKMLDDNMISETVKPRVINVINRFPTFDMNATLNMAVHDIDIYKLAEVSNVEYIIIPEIEKVNEKFIVNIEFYDIRKLSLLGKYTKECNCSFEDVVFLILPEAAKQLSNSKFRLKAKCPDGMEKFKGTSFNAGSSIPFDNNPSATVTVKSFCVDKFEYPNKLGAMPKSNVSWLEAHKLCISENKRLCTEIEWEYACRGKFNFKYPYGNQYLEERCNTESEKAEKSGKFMDCHGKIHVYDMTGNLNEWTGSNWDSNIRNKVIRGGGWFSGEKESRCTLRFSNKPSIKAKPIGFRCCKSVK